ncbi:MAG: hypothetical protein ACOX0U_00460 [Oscillospiraceae bacterium]|jgi:hypothetical protein
MEKRVDDFLNRSDVSSATECTGLMPTPPLNAEEYRSYQNLSSMGLPRRKYSNADHRPVIENGCETTPTEEPNPE